MAANLGLGRWSFTGVSLVIARCPGLVVAAANPLESRSQVVASRPQGLVGSVHWSRGMGVLVAPGGCSDVSTSSIIMHRGGQSARSPDDCS